MSKVLKISPSQIATKRACLRQWVLAHVFYLPSLKKSYFAFGSILHKVLERWLKGDENGRDAQGKAVDLYPDGWETFVERDGSSQTLTDEEQDLVRELVQLGIEQGIVERIPGRMIEEYYSREVIDGVVIHGFMDLLFMDALRVEDHKTTKNRRYALSEDKLSRDIKMRCYAIEVAMRYFELKGKKPHSVVMRINYFLKDPLKPKVFKRQANVDVEELDGEWERIVEDATEMKTWAEKFQNYLDYEDKPDYTGFDHEEIPGPECTDVCNAYGGCPYQNICTGRESVHQYFRRVDKILHPPAVKEKKTMGSVFASRLAEIKKNKGMTPAKETQEPEAPPAAPEGDGKPEAQPPPWADAECTKCGGSGLDEHDSACPVCFKLAKQAGLPLPEDCRFDEATGQWNIYTQTKDEEEIPVMGNDGNLKGSSEKPVDLPKDSTAQKKSPAQDKPKGKGKGKGKSENPLAAAKKKKAAEKAAETEQKDQPSAEDAKPKGKGNGKTTIKNKSGRPPQGYTLCIGAAPLRTGTREVLYAEQLLEKAKQMIVDELQQQYEEQDAFKRRDMAVLAVRSMIDGFGSAFIISPNLNYATQDLRAIVEELKVHASMVIATIGY